MAHRLRVLGPPEVLDDSGEPVSLSLGKPLALLVYVACIDSPVSRDDLADLLWPEADRQRGRHSVRQAVWVLRNAFGEDLFEKEDPLSLKPGALEVDLHRFEDALKEERIEEAREYWRAPFVEHFVLAGVRHWNHWCEEVRSALEARFSKTLFHHAQSLAEAGEAERAVAVMDQAVKVRPASGATHLARIELLLDLLRIDAAREAVADAHRDLGEDWESRDQLATLEGRLEEIVLEQRSRVAEGESFPMEFVGRSRELAELHGLWRDAERGLTRVAVITGASGIGKTRLAQELLSYVSGPDVLGLSLKGTRAETKLRWGAVSDLVRQLLRLPGSAGISSASDSLLRAMLPSLGRDAIDLQTMNGVSPAAILDAVVDLLESVAFESPILLLVDDFQWMDADSRTLFLGLANRCRELRMLLLILGRSDLSSRHWEHLETSLVSESGARRFLLKPLIEEEVGELLALGAAFPDPADAAAVVAGIHKASAGNPLFIREVLEELHEQGVLAREGPGWVFRTSNIPEGFELPENIQQLLRERMDRLSEPGASLAAALARENRKSSSETLQRLTQLPPAVFTQAVAELLERGVVEWVNGSSLDFVHDLLRETAVSHLAGSLPEPPPRPGWLKKNRVFLAMAAGVVLALPVGVLWGSGALGNGGTPEPGLFGGGRIIFQSQVSDPLALEVSSASPEEWLVRALDPSPPPGARSIFPAPGGGYFWFGIRDDPSGPDMTRIIRDGSVIPIFPEEGDQTLKDLTPDGSRILFVSENLGVEPFSHSLFQGWLDSGRTERIYEGHGHVSGVQYSPDGDLVAFSASAIRDTLIVSSLHGERVGSAILGTTFSTTWCGSSLLATSAMEDRSYLFRFDIPTMAVDTLAQVEYGTQASCSPDGTAVAFMGVEDWRMIPMILELESRRIHRLPQIDLPVLRLEWLPAHPPPIPVQIRAGTDTIRIARGDERTLEAAVSYTDGSESQAGVRWESLNPAVATVGPYQELTANGAGRTMMLARWGYSLADTVVVEVEDIGTQWETVTENFDDPVLPQWQRVGTSPPEARGLDGEPVLRFFGDEKYADGLLLSSPLSLDQGITIEMEFRISLTRDVHQNFGFCLQDIDRRRSDLETGALVFENGSCVHYPALEFQKLDPTELALGTHPGPLQMVRVPEDLPSDDWVHIALQVRADGYTSLVINRRRVGSAPVLLKSHEGKDWFLLLQGDAVGTELYVRNLSVWRGERY
ncbi:MAG: AAA family ATPase [Gemmatimonadota bacterium]